MKKKIKHRVYNGEPSKLMDDIYDGLMEIELDILKIPGWPVISLYLARTCQVLEEKGWNKSEITYTISCFSNNKNICPFCKRSIPNNWRIGEKCKWCDDKYHQKKKK